MSNLNEMKMIIAPLPRRTHSNLFNDNHKFNQSKFVSQNNLIHSKPIKLNHDLDEVLTEFLSLFNPSEPVQSIPIFIDHQSNLISSDTHSSDYHHNISKTSLFETHLDHQTVQINTTQSQSQTSSPSPLESINLDLSSFSSPHPIIHQDEIDHQTFRINQNDHLVSIAIPNHLSTIVSSPISRCHNPLPRHAGLDDLARHLAEPFTSLDAHQQQKEQRDHHLHQVEEENPPTPQELHAAQNCDDLSSELIPFSSLNHPVIPEPDLP